MRREGLLSSDWVGSMGLKFERYHSGKFQACWKEGPRMALDLQLVQRTDVADLMAAVLGTAVK